MPRPRRQVKILKDSAGVPPIEETPNAFLAVPAIELDDVMDLRNLAEEEAKEEAMFFSAADIEDEIEDEAELEDDEELIVDLEMDDEFAPMYEEHTMRGYGRVIMKDRPLRKQAFNSKGEEVPFEDRNSAPVEQIEIPVRPQTIAACEAAANIPQQKEAAQKALDTAAEVRRMMSQMREDRLVNEIQLQATKVKNLKAEQARIASARRKGFLG
jgi:hypothetical protein